MLGISVGGMDEVAAERGNAGEQAMRNLYTDVNIELAMELSHVETVQWDERRDLRYRPDSARACHQDDAGEHCQVQQVVIFPMTSIADVSQLWGRRVNSLDSSRRASVEVHAGNS